MMENIKPMDIEKRSFAIITELLGDTKLEEENELVIKRVIHTTADFDYADNLVFSDHAVTKGIEALRAGTAIDKIYLAKGETDKTLGHIASRAREAGVVVVEADRRKLDAMSRTHSHESGISNGTSSASDRTSSPIFS